MNSKMREDVNAIVSASLQAVLPDEAVSRALKNYSNAGGRTILVSAGKAAWQMANAAVKELGSVDDGIVVTKYEHVMGEIPGVKCFEAGHPVRVDVHGISRACFETWARENYRELGAAIDLCLHHKIDPRYESAYNRYEYLKERRQLLQGWADFLLPASTDAKP